MIQLLKKQYHLKDLLKPRLYKEVKFSKKSVYVQPLSCLHLTMDEVCFQRAGIQDYKLEDLINPPEPILKHLIDYRVKLLLKEDLVLHPGQEELVATACMIGDGIADFCLHIKRSENIPLTLLSEGYISELFSGRILVKLANYRGETIRLFAGTEVGFVIVNTFSMN